MEVVVTGSVAQLVNYCTMMTGDNCIQWTNVVFTDGVFLTKALFFAGIMLFLFLIMGWLFRVLFAKFFGGKSDNF